MDTHIYVKFIIKRLTIRYETLVSLTVPRSVLKQPPIAKVVDVPQFPYLLII